MARENRHQVMLTAALTLGSMAAMPAALAQSLQHDTALPIEITADSLEVLQNQNIATFQGNVDAVQGDMVLSADQLRVHYRSGADGEPTAAGDSSIRRIEAEGNVFLSSPRETAQGAAGTYDVAANRVTIEGSVVLTRDDNVIRGERLEMDLVSGRSQMFAGTPSTEGGNPAQRVRALFTPDGAQRSSPSSAEQPAAPGAAN
jgi:lipopolysaccharide export system protein LptA